MRRMRSQPDIKLQIKEQTEEPMLVSRTHAHRARFVSKAPGSKPQARNEPLGTGTLQTTGGARDGEAAMATTAYGGPWYSYAGEIGVWRRKMKCKLLR